MAASTPLVTASFMTLAVSGVIVAVLWQSMYRLLTDLCCTEQRADFWTKLSAVFLFLVPVTTLFLGREVAQNPDLMIAVIDHLRWAFVGLIFALFVVGMSVAAFIPQRGRSAIGVDRDQMDDLRRLLDKVEEIRARELLRNVERGGDV